MARLRVVHAVVGLGAVDVGALASETVLGDSDVLFDRVGYPLTASPPYAELAPLAGATIRVQSDGDAADRLDVSDVTLPAGRVATAFAIGTADAPALLLCDDADGDGSCAVE